MTEKLLQYIWKHRYYRQQGLALTSGEQVVVEYPGDLNTHQGPDFINARIRVNGTCWAGSIELHLFSSGWEKHHHTEDDNYRNVILHVVWKQDRLLLNRSIPELELCNRIPRIMQETYDGWMRKPVFVPCESAASKMHSEVWDDWASRVLTMRLNRKMQEILLSLEKNHFHWEEQLWWMLAANFGNPVNTQAFETMARSIPYSLLVKNRHHPFKLEALLMGQANLLEEVFTDEFPRRLKREFCFARTKYRLEKIYEPVHFLRMRPENFPSVRLSQLAGLCVDLSGMFKWILECESIASLRKKFQVKASDYWENHYVFDRVSGPRGKYLGLAMRDNIILNTVIPLLFTYGKINPDTTILKKAIRWLGEIPAEQNEQILSWKSIGINIRKAAGSQALIELKKQFCDQRRCLECDIGKQLLKPSRQLTSG